MGTNASYINIDKSKIRAGRFYAPAENNSLAKVVVLGPKIKDQLFGPSDALGEFVKIRNTKFRVIGVMEEKGAVMTMDFDEFIYIPIKTLQKRVMGIEHITYMVHKLKDVNRADLTAERARETLRENHNIQPETDINGKPTTAKDDFRVTTMAEMMDMLSIATNAVTFLLLCIVVVSLIVGGVGIMNIMYVIVRERTPEIGLRKAVGASYSDIMRQFLTEAVVITLVGGIIGIFVGIVLSFFLAYAIRYFGLEWDWSIPVQAYVIALAFSFFCGLFFGVYPAKEAARQNPIEALRGS
jgi:putative ABC transport system permease protein